MAFVCSFFTDNKILTAVFPIGGFALAMISAVILKTFTYQGTITLTENALITVIEKETKIYNLIEINDLKLYYYQFEGDAKGPQGFPGKGVGNYLSFTTGTEELSFELQLKRGFINELNRLFAIWERQGITIEISKAGDKVNKVS
ncbi:hypothetical protein GCM10022209_01250 [Chitinophaga oryziterrae]